MSLSRTPSCFDCAPAADPGFSFSIPVPLWRNKNDCVLTFAETTGFNPLMVAWVRALVVGLVLFYASVRTLLLWKLHAHPAHYILLYIVSHSAFAAGCLSFFWLCIPSRNIVSSAVLFVCAKHRFFDGAETPSAGHPTIRFGIRQFGSSLKFASSEFCKSSNP